MNFLPVGHFFGDTNRRIRLGGITLTDTEYTHPYVDWHYHENAYFTFILQGSLIEGNKKERYHCPPGGLLFHSWQEPHYNVKPEGFARGFHIEFDRDSLADFSFDLNDLAGSFKVENPDIKFLLYRVFRETKFFDSFTAASVQTLLLDILGRMLRLRRVAYRWKPPWAGRLKEILHDDYAENLSLKRLSRQLNVHPVHLSRDFSKHFGCTLGEYVRKIRVEKSLSLLPDKSLSLTEIAFACGFADQSHFLRCFKQINGVSPSEFRRALLDRC